MKEGRHFRWTEPIYAPNFDLTSLALLGLIFLFMAASVLKSLWGHFEYPYPQILRDMNLSSSIEVILRLTIPILLVLLAARGSVGAHHLGMKDSQISAWSNVNELTLNSVWCINK